MRCFTLPLYGRLYIFMEENNVTQTQLEIRVVLIWLCPDSFA